MGIVVPHDPLSIEVMQCQRITNPMRDLGSRSDLPCLNLDPVPIVLDYDLAVQIKKSVDSVISRQQLYHQLIILQKHSCLKLDDFQRDRLNFISQQGIDFSRDRILDRILSVVLPPEHRKILQKMVLSERLKDISVTWDSSVLPQTRHFMIQAAYLKISTSACLLTAASAWA